MSSATLANDGEEDDYMSMNIVEPKPPRKETYTQRRLRKQREVCLNLFFRPNYLPRSFNLAHLPLPSTLIVPFPL